VIRKTKKNGAEDPLYDDVKIHDGGVSSKLPVGGVRRV